MNNPKAQTPVMRQFWEAKKSHPDSIMLFRMGDFYETFEEDAIIASKILGRFFKTPIFLLPVDSGVQTSYRQVKLLFTKFNTKIVIKQRVKTFQNTEE